MNKPAFTTAIPLRRFRFGEFTLTVLGEIESSNSIRYTYIMAVIQGENPEPGIWLTAEQCDDATYEMRLIMHDGEEVIGQSEQWDDVNTFVEEAVKVVSQILSLSDEVPYQLM